MNPRTIKSRDSISVYISFIVGREGKRRPILVLSVHGEELYFYQLTSQYKSKSKKIKSQYYPLKNWQEVGLKKKTYVDIGLIRSVNRLDLDKITRIGHLTVTDQDGLADFILRFKMNM